MATKTNRPLPKGGELAEMLGARSPTTKQRTQAEGKVQPLLGTIHIKNIEFQGYHGVYPEERKILRRFQIDAVIHFDVTSAMRSDQLTDTIDYFKICDVIFRIGTETTFHLLEGLAGALLKEILRRWPHVGIEMEVRKLYPPCPGNPDFISVRAGHLRK